MPTKLTFAKTDALGRPRPRAKLPCSLEEVRSLFLACVAVCGRHNLVPEQPEILVQLSTRPVVDENDPHKKEWGGLAWRAEGRLRLYVRADHDRNLTIVMHEYLHLVGFDRERVVSTLTARFKQETAEIAATLLKGYYRGAAYLAHTRPGMAYPKPHLPAAYNDDQWLKVKVVWPAQRRRKTP